MGENTAHRDKGHFTNLEKLEQSCRQNQGHRQVQLHSPTPVILFLLYRKYWAGGGSCHEKPHLNLMERSVCHQGIQDFIWKPCLSRGRPWQRLLVSHQNPFPLLPITQRDCVFQSCLVGVARWLSFSPRLCVGGIWATSRPASPKPPNAILPTQISLKACCWRWGDLWQSESLTCYLALDLTTPLQTGTISNLPVSNQ